MIFRCVSSSALLLAGLLICNPAFAQQCVDSDGDGYGWDGFDTCTVLQAVSNPAANNTECVDVDGDGYGWDGFDTCTVSQTTNTSVVNSIPVTNNNECVDFDGDGYGWDGFDTCTVSQAASIPAANNNSVANGMECIDVDGDGYGWDGFNTCTVSQAVSAPVANNPVNNECIDVDGDGYGWDGFDTCTVAQAASNFVGGNSQCIDVDGDGYGWDGVDTCIVQAVAVTPVVSVATATPSPDAITDIILMMGQSNALGENTQVDMSQDSADSRIIVWTQFNDWQVGNLCTQKWQKAWFPWRGGICSNHPAFQIAKHIVELDGSRRVAVIPTGTAGMPIRWWDANGIADQQVNATVLAALASLGEIEVDLVAWAQGESDHGNENAWKLKLDDLISRIRQRPWFDAGRSQFIAQETKWSSVNLKVRELGSDGDPLTDWVAAADQPTKDGVHWSGAAIRVIGERFANKYVY